MKIDLYLTIAQKQPEIVPVECNWDINAFLQLSIHVSSPPNLPGGEAIELVAAEPNVGHHAQANLPRLGVLQLA